MDWSVEIVGWTVVTLVVIVSLFVLWIGLALFLATWAEWRNHRQLMRDLDGIAAMERADRARERREKTAKAPAPGWLRLRR